MPADLTDPEARSLTDRIKADVAVSADQLAFMCALAPIVCGDASAEDAQ